jgi:hypothetical protein
VCLSGVFVEVRSSKQRKGAESVQLRGERVGVRVFEEVGGFEEVRGRGGVRRGCCRERSFEEKVRVVNAD